MIKRIWESLGLSAGIILITVIGQIVTVPLLLTHWGAQLYGEWVTLTNLVASLTILNLGVQTYVLNLLVAHYVRGEIEAGMRVLHAALRLYTLLCSAALMITLAMVVWPGLQSWLNIHALSAFDMRLIVLIQGALAAYTILSGLLMTVLIAIQQQPHRLKYALVQRIFMLAIPVIVAVLGGLPLSAALAIGLLIGGMAVIQIWDVRRRSPFVLGISQAVWAEARALIRPSLEFVAVSASMVLLSTGVVVVVSASAGAMSVALFTTTLMLTNFIRTIISQGTNVLWPEITASASTGDPARLARWHRLIVKLVSGFGLLVAAGLSLLGEEVLVVWTRGEVAVDGWLNVLLAIYLVVHAPALVSRVFGLATNQQSELFRIEFTTAIISLALSVLLAPAGVRGIALALIAGQIINTVWVLRSACRWTDDNGTQLLHHWLRLGIPTALTAGLLSLLIAAFLPGFLARGLGLCVMILISIYVAWYTWLIPAERTLIARALRVVLKHSPEAGAEGVA